MKSIDMKVPPRSINEFIEWLGGFESETNGYSIAHYSQYLNECEDAHHYQNFGSLTEWLTNEIIKFVKDIK